MAVAKQKPAYNLTGTLAFESFNSDVEAQTSVNALILCLNCRNINYTNNSARPGWGAVVGEMAC
jgi:hypothetical protein